MAAEEDPLGTWRLRDGLGREYAVIELRRVDGSPRYRVTMQGELLGYGMTLRGACERAHRAYIRTLIPSGPPNGRH